VLGEKSSGGLNHKQLERRRGFLIYVAHAYPSPIPYLKGIYLTLDSCRSRINKDDRKRLRYDMEHLRHGDNPKAVLGALSEDAPPLVIPVPRLEHDLNALLELTEPLAPPEKAFISNHVLQVCYSFGDAGGDGFGSIILLDGIIDWEYGSWKEFYKAYPSNWREF
jgi:hypothetical protein